MDMSTEEVDLSGDTVQEAKLPLTDVLTRFTLNQIGTVPGVRYETVGHHSNPK